MQILKMTTRRWMAAVAVVAVLAAAVFEADKALKRRTRYAAALGEFRASKMDYEVGRVSLDRCVEKSRCVMDAQLALCVTRGQQSAAILDHIGRATSPINQEINWPWGLHDTEIERAPEIAEARKSLLEARVKLNRLN
jgi:hypothetical protein